jgi:hypothetical protein
MSEITTTDANLLIHKLYVEQIPLTVYYHKNEVKVLQHGFLAGVSNEHGILVSKKKTDDPLAEKPDVLYDYVAVQVDYNADGIGWKFSYNDSVDERFGDTSLRFECPDGGRLILYFSV